MTVKPLEWERIEDEQLAGGITAIAISAFGKYQAWGSGLWSDPFATYAKVYPGSIEQACAAAQADYEQRILSALSASGKEG